MRNKVSTEYRKFVKAKRLKALRDVQSARDKQVIAEMELAELVQVARSFGASWDEVAGVLGCSRAWAHRRFRLSALDQLLVEVPVNRSVDVVGFTRAR